MKFMILVKSNPDLETRLAAMSDSQMKEQKEQMAAIGVFNEELRKAGVMRTATACARAAKASGCASTASRAPSSTGRSPGISLPGIGSGSCRPSKRRLPGSSAARIRCLCRRKSKSGRYEGLARGPQAQSRKKIGAMK